MENFRSVSVQDSAGASGGGDMSTPTAVSIGDNASVQPPQGIHEEDDANDSPLPELGGRADGRLRWLAETRIVMQGRTCREQKRLDINSAALFAEEALAIEGIQEWLGSTTRCCLVA